MPIRHHMCSLLVLALAFTTARGTDATPGIIELDTPGGPLPFWVYAEIPTDFGGSVTTGSLRVSPARPPQMQIFVTWDEVHRPKAVVYPTVTIDLEAKRIVEQTTRMVLRFPGFDSELEWRRPDHPTPSHSIIGEWRIGKRDGTKRVPLMTRSRDPRDWQTRTLFQLEGGKPEIRSGRYSVTFSSSPDTPAVGVFEINDDHTAAGTFMTTTGDYRYLAGNAAGDTLKLSTFDGAHAFLFHAKLQDDGSLAGDFWSGNWWHETWTAAPDPDAALPDPFAETKYRGDEAALTRMHFTALDGTPTPVGTLAPHGSPRIVVVFGSWCPNCHDATRLLTRLHAEYKDRGLRVLGLAFEHEQDHDRAAERVKAYADDLGVGYPLLIAGLSDKKKASEALPVLDRFRSYPTTMFIDHDGSIRAVHTGFTGPATGDAYTDLVASFTAHIEAMIEKQDAGADMPRD